MNHENNRPAPSEKRPLRLTNRGKAAAGTAAVATAATIGLLMPTGEPVRNCLLWQAG